MRIEVGRIYCHVPTGRMYRVEGIYREEDLGVDFVAHVGLHDGRKWARSVANFTGEKNGKKRFMAQAELEFLPKCKDSITASEIVAIPRGVYYDVSCDFFRNAVTNESMGKDFSTYWGKRAMEFPQRAKDCLSR